MFAATAYVVSRSWPSSGMPWLAAGAHLAAIATVTIEILTRAFKMMASARSIGVPLRFGTALRACLAGDFAAAITPARTGAEPARFLVLAESGVNAASRVMVLFLELFLEMISLALVCGLLAFLFRNQGTSAIGLAGVVAGYSSAVLGLGVFGWFLSRRRASGPPPGVLRSVGLNAGHWRVVQRMLRQLRQVVGELRSSDRVLMSAALLGSVVHVLCKVATLPVLVLLSAESLSVTRESLAPLVLWPLALFYGGAVIPAPGGGGVIEGAFALTLQDAIPPAIFAASLLWWRFYTFYLYIIIGGTAAGNAAMRAIRR